MEICDSKGRDCIEKYSSETFNCSTTCVGIYAYVWNIKEETAVWNIEEDTADENSATYIEDDMRANSTDDVLDRVQRRLVELERKMERMEKVVGQKEEELDKEKFKLLIAEYKKFKSKNIQHFRFSFSGASSAFGE